MRDFTVFVAVISASENPRFLRCSFCGATLSDEVSSRSEIFLLFIWIKEPCVRKFEGLARSKLLGISQTDLILAFPGSSE